MLFAGIDGGQSGSRAAIADERGTVLARVDGGPLFASGRLEASGLVAPLSALVRRARSAAGEAGRGELAALVAGISGQDCAAALPPEVLGAASARVLHDAEVAHAGALAGYHGIVVVAGSGSVAFGTDRLGRRVRRGGWGRLFGDEGSAFWIARRAISAAMRAADDGRATGLTHAACARFRVADLRALQHAALSGAVRAEDVSEFAPAVLALAAEGDAEARETLRSAAASLSDLAHAVDRCLEPSRGRAVSFAGKVFDSWALREAWREVLGSALSEPRIIAPRAEPVIGALALAYRDAGFEPPPALWSKT